MSEDRGDARKQQPSGEPIIEDDRLPRMEVDLQRRHARKAEMRPVDTIGERRGGRTRGRAPTMEPRLADLTRAQGILPQQVPQSMSVTRGEGESYIRLTVHNENGKLTVVGAREVEGPLASPDTLPVGLVWEVAVGQQRISLGSLPDAGVLRSFANRDVPGPEGHHGFQEVSAFDFQVRIPRQALAATEPSNLRINLYRLRRALERRVSTEPLGQQLGENELAVVARLDGLRADRIADPARVDVARVLRLRL